MGAPELALLVLAYLQPVVLGLLLWLSLWTTLAPTVYLSGASFMRRRFASTRFFECAAYSRLVGWLRYGSQAIGLTALFLLYDVDLVFFLSETLNFEQWTPAHLLLWASYLGFFVLGLFYDLRRYGFMWTW